MRHDWYTLAAFGLGALAATACGPEAPPETATTTEGAVADGGRSLNTRSLVGRRRGGGELEGVLFRGAELAGQELAGLHLVGSELRGQVGDQEVKAADLVGAVVRGSMSNGALTDLYIDSVTDPASGGDIYTYSVSYEHDGQLYPLCGAHPDGSPIEAIALRGAWSYREGVEGGGARVQGFVGFTFACQDAALAQCVALGYAPWRGPVDAAHHQACTRMLRADYCGDGTSFAEKDRAINFYDKIGIQMDVQAWTHEAEWDEDGSRCISSSRVHSIMQRRGALGDGVVPACIVRQASARCGQRARLDRRTLIVSELLVPPQQQPIPSIP